METADILSVGATRVSTPPTAATSPIGASRTTVLRIGGWSGVIGALLALVSNALHPHPTDYKLETLLGDIARSSTWSAIHMILIVALMFVFVTLVALTLSMDREPGASLSRVACAVALLGGALLLVSTAIDGFAMNQLADDWVAAPATEKAAALRAAGALEDTGYAVYSVSTMLFLGIGIMLYGLAMLLGDQYPRWLGWLAILGGGGELVVGMVQALSGPEYRGAELPDVVFSVLITFWLLIVGISMWRQSREPDADPATVELEPIRV